MNTRNKRSYDDWKGNSWKDDYNYNKGASWTNKRPRTDDWKSSDRNGGGWGQGRRQNRDREPFKTKEDLDDDLEKYFGRSSGEGGKSSLDMDLESYMGRKGEKPEKTLVEEAVKEEAQDKVEEAEEPKET
eukprot:symbB.v1.2.004129.t1/scaffold232.1/size259024/6